MTLRPLVVLAAVALVTLVGCKDDSGSNADPAPTPDQTVSTTSSPSPSGTASSPAATTGQLIEHDALSLRLTADQDWKVLNSGVLAIRRDEEGNEYAVTVNEIPDRSNGTMTLDQAAELSLSSTTLYDPPLTRGENRVIDGVEGWTAETIDSAFNEYVYRYGAVHADHDTYVTVRVPRKDAQNREWIEAVLASIDWK